MSTTNSNLKTNPWKEIPLNDYEKHMADNSVGQLKLLNYLTKKYLDKIKPHTCLFLGVAGGNGLEHIDNKVTENVIGIDINQDYLDETRRRYDKQIKTLQLINFDIGAGATEICKADAVWAALIMEYTGISDCLQFADRNLLLGGHFVVSIQINNGLKAVSLTAVESIKKAGEIFSQVDPEELVTKITATGFLLIDNEVNMLPNGKSIGTFHFTKDKMKISKRRATTTNAKLPNGKAFDKVSDGSATDISK